MRDLFLRACVTISVYSYLFNAWLAEKMGALADDLPDIDSAEEFPHG